MIHWITLVFLTILPNLLHAKGSKSLDVSNGKISADIGDQGIFFEDVNSEFDLEEAFSQHQSGAFKPHPKKRNSFGFSKSTWWSALPITQDSEKPVELNFIHKYANADLIEMYLVSQTGDILFQKIGGDKLINNPEAIENRLVTLNGVLPQGKYYLFTKILTSGSVIFDIRVEDAKTYAINNVWGYVLVCSLIGMISIMAIYNLCMYIQLRRTTYLLYVFFVCTQIYAPLVYTGMFKHIFSDFTFFMNDGFLHFSALASISIYMFANRFLGIHKHRWLTYLLRFGYLHSFLLVAATMYDYNLGGKIGVLNGMLCSVISLGCGITLSLKGIVQLTFIQ